MDRHTEFVQPHMRAPWRDMRDMRNRMGHGDFDIDLEVVWDTAQVALPELLQELPAARDHAEDESRDDRRMGP